MRSMRITIAIAVLALGVLAGCKEKIEGELGTPFSKVDGLNGTWQLTAFTQTDLNNPVKETRDLTDFYTAPGVDPMVISFNGDDRTYGVEIEAGKNFFGDGGEWFFDDENYPTFLHLDTGSDTLTFDLTTAIRTYDQSMELEINKGCGDSETVIYRFEFNRINP